MNYRRDFEQQSPVDGAPTMAAPAAGQQPGALPQQAPAGGPSGGPGAYPLSGQPPGHVLRPAAAAVRPAGSGSVARAVAGVQAAGRGVRRCSSGCGGRWALCLPRGCRTTTCRQHRSTTQERRRSRCTFLSCLRRCQVSRSWCSSRRPVSRLRGNRRPLLGSRRRIPRVPALRWSIRIRLCQSRIRILSRSRSKIPSRGNNRIPPTSKTRRPARTHAAKWTTRQISTRAIRRTRRLTTCCAIRTRRAARETIRRPRRSSSRNNSSPPRKNPETVMDNPQNFDPTQRISDRTQQLGDRTQQLGDRTNQLSPPTVATPTGRRNLSSRRPGPNRGHTKAVATRMGKPRPITTTSSRRSSITTSRRSTSTRRHRPTASSRWRHPPKCRFRGTESRAFCSAAPRVPHCWLSPR